MSEFLAVSFTFNLFLLYRYFALHKKLMMLTALLFRISRGEASIKSDQDGVKIEFKQA